MWTILKAVFYLSILTFGFISFTGSISPNLTNESASLIELTKQGFRWTAEGHAETSKVEQKPCTYDVKMESKFKDLKEPLPFRKGFFDANNVDISVKAECPEILLPKKSVEDLHEVMLNYKHLTYTQRVVVDYRVKTGYYRPIVIEKTKLPYETLSAAVWKYYRLAYFVFLLNRVASLLFRKYIIGN